MNMFTWIIKNSRAKAPSRKEIIVYEDFNDPPLDPLPVNREEKETELSGSGEGNSDYEYFVISH